MSTYVTIGTIVAGSVTAVTSTTFTTNVAINVGDLVVMRFGLGASARPSGLACVDQTGGTTNTFAIAIDGSPGTTQYACIFWCVATSAIPSGGTIKVSWTTATGFNVVDGIKCTNPSSSTPLDAAPTKFNSGVASTNATSGTVASPSTSDWVGVCMIYHNTSSATPQAGWTEDNDNSATGFESQTIIGTNTTAMQGAGTLVAATSWSCAAAVFKLGAAAKKANRPVVLSAAVMRAGTR